jgi:hypothetical protein
MAIRDLVDKLEGALEELITLEIVTAVGAVQPTTRDADGRKKALAIDPGAKILRTRINLLQGNITAEMDPALAADEGKAVREFHAEREKQAVEMVRANVEALKSLVVFIESRIEKKS